MILDGPFRPPFRSLMLLDAARSTLRTIVVEGDGGECPCCNQVARKYDRRMTAVSSRALLALHSVFGRRPGRMVDVARAHLPEVAHQGGQLLLGQHWGLLEPVDVDGSHDGQWRITDKGESWIAGRIGIPKYVTLYAGAVCGYHGDPVSIDDTLSETFALAQLLTARRTIVDRQTRLFGEADAA